MIQNMISHLHSQNDSSLINKLLALLKEQQIKSDETVSAACMDYTNTE